jgi:hypothetical protein
MDGHCFIYAINKVRSKLKLPELDIATICQRLIHFYTEDPIGTDEVLNDNRAPEKLYHNFLHNWLDENALFALTHILNCKFILYHINENARFDDGNSFTPLSSKTTRARLLTNSTHYEPLLVHDKVDPLTNPRKSQTSPPRKTTILPLESSSSDLPKIRKNSSTSSCNAAKSPEAATAKIKRNPRATSSHNLPEPSITLPRRQRAARSLPPSFQPRKSASAYPNYVVPIPIALKPEAKAKSPQAEVA